MAAADLKQTFLALAVCLIAGAPATAATYTDNSINGPSYMRIFYTFDVAGLDPAGTGRVSVRVGSVEFGIPIYFSIVLNGTELGAGETSGTLLDGGYTFERSSVAGTAFQSGSNTLQLMMVSNFEEAQFETDFLSVSYPSLDDVPAPIPLPASAALLLAALAGLAALQRPAA